MLGNLWDSVGLAGRSDVRNTEYIKSMTRKLFKLDTLRTEEIKW